MKRSTIYLDTTIPNYVFNNHVPDKQKSAKMLFENIIARQYDAYISDVVLRELRETPNPNLRKSLIKQVENIPVLELTDECLSLGNQYIDKGIIPEENTDDAFHIALATVYEIDFLVSYNFEHIVRVRTIDQITAVNLLAGYKTPRIIIPEEIIYV